MYITYHIAIMCVPLECTHIYKLVTFNNFQTSSTNYYVLLAS